MGMVGVVMLTALAAGLIQSVTGFGGALVMMMTLPYFVTMKTATALAGLICVPMWIHVAYRYKDKVQVKKILLPTAIYLVSSAICIHAAARINLDSLKAIFGLLLIGLAAYFNFFSAKLNLKGSFTSALLCAGLSGVTGGLFGIGGPLLVLYYSSVTKDKEEYLGTMNFIFTITETYSAWMRYMNGLITPDLYTTILFGFAAMIAGSLLGCRVVAKLDGNKMKKGIYLLLAVSGAITFIKAI